MSKNKSRGLGALVGVGALLAFGGIAWASESKNDPGRGKGSGGGGGGPGSGGGGGSDTPGGGGSTDPRAPGGGGKGWIYGGGSDPASGRWPADFDFSSNALWISPDCEVVLEGDWFRPSEDGFVVNAIEPTEHPGYIPGQEVSAVLAVMADNSIAGFVDWAMDHGYPAPPEVFMAWVSERFVLSERPEPSPVAVALGAEVLRQLSPLCLDVPDPAHHWGPGLELWMEDFLVWLDQYLREWWSSSIDFELDALPGPGEPPGHGELPVPGAP